MTTAVERWNAMVEAEHAQAERLRDPAPPTSDHWQSLADQFRGDPYRPDDPLVEFLADRIEPHQTLLDVGAGAGRLALPLALRCRRVVAVEPSPSMASALLEDAERHGISNVSLVQAKWEEARVESEDVVLCVHVLYVVRDIQSFLRKLEAHAQEQVWAVLFPEPPQRRIYPLWQRVHGEKRLWLPSLPQLKDVLKEMGVEPRLTPVPPQQPGGLFGGFVSLEDAHVQLRGRLFLTEGSPKDQLLGQVLADELEEFEEGLRLKGFAPMEPVLVSWFKGLAQQVLDHQEALDYGQPHHVPVYPQHPARAQGAEHSKDQVLVH